VIAFIWTITCTCRNKCQVFFHRSLLRLPKRGLISQVFERLNSPLGGHLNLSSLIDERIRPDVWQVSEATSLPILHRRNYKFIVSEWAPIQVPLTKKG